MSMIDDFASRENITKAAVITRALDCMQASYDSGNDRARGRRKGRKGPYRKHGILRASTLFEGSPNLKEAFTYTRFHHLPRLPHFPYNTQAAPYPPSGAAFFAPANRANETVAQSNCLISRRVWQALGGGETGGKSVANLRSKTRGTGPREGSKAGHVRCRFWCRECARGSDPLAHLHAVSGGAGAAIGVCK